MRPLLPLLAGLALAGCQTAAGDQPVQRVEADTLISGGTVYDGSGATGRVADVVIDEGQIVHIGSDAALQYRARARIVADGLVVAPGFIDPHTHAGSDLASSDEARRANLPFAFQGVSTVVIGNDGGGRPDIAAQAAKLRRDGIGTNAAFLVGFGPVREAALGKANRAPTDPEMDSMKALTRSAMCEGAWGFSTGLYYVPQNYAETSEVVALARIASEFGGYYDTHMRDESTYNIGVEGALAEAIAIGREGGVPLHIAHIKALGPAVWGHSARMIAAIEQAQESGLRVTADQYPWTASGTRISNALIPRWALEGGLDGLRGRLADLATRERIHAGMIAGLERRGGADKLLVTGNLGDARVAVGETLAQIAEAQGLAPVDAALAILEVGDARVASFNMSEADIRAFAAQDWVVTGSDGSTGHPRKYGSFPKAFRTFVRQDRSMDLARFIHRSSGRTAEIIGLTDRGLLRAGMAADVLVFDPETFAPRADYQSPRELSVGVRHLLVNGEAVITDGTYTGALPGKPLLKDNSC